jgi:hypothetical protein
VRVGGTQQQDLTSGRCERCSNAICDAGSWLSLGGNTDTRFGGGNNISCPLASPRHTYSVGNSDGLFSATLLAAEWGVLTAARSFCRPCSLSGVFLPPGASWMGGGCEYNCATPPARPDPLAVFDTRQCAWVCSDGYYFGAPGTFSVSMHVCVFLLLFSENVCFGRNVFSFYCCSKKTFVLAGTFSVSIVVLRKRLFWQERFSNGHVWHATHETSAPCTNTSGAAAATKAYGVSHALRFLGRLWKTWSGPETSALPNSGA